MPSDQDDPYVPFNIYIRKSKKQRIQRAADAKGVPLAVIGRWIYELPEADDLLRSLGAPATGGMDAADPPTA